MNIFHRPTVMKYSAIPCTVLVLAFLFPFSGRTAASTDIYVLKNDRLEIAVGGNAEIVRLTNVRTGWNYASGQPVWRLYYDTKKEKEHEIGATENVPKVSRTDSAIKFEYGSLKHGQATLKMRLLLRIVLEDDFVRFYSKIENDEPATIVRELQYPLIGDCRLPDGTLWP